MIKLFLYKTYQSTRQSVRCIRQSLQRFTFTFKAQALVVHHKLLQLLQGLPSVSMDGPRFAVEKLELLGVDWSIKQNESMLEESVESVESVSQWSAYIVAVEKQLSEHFQFREGITSQCNSTRRPNRIVWQTKGCQGGRKGITGTTHPGKLSFGCGSGEHLHSFSWSWHQIGYCYEQALLAWKSWLVKHWLNMTPSFKRASSIVPSSPSPEGKCLQTQQKRGQFHEFDILETLKLQPDLIYSHY